MACHAGVSQPPAAPYSILLTNNTACMTSFLSLSSVHLLRFVFAHNIMHGMAFGRSVVPGRAGPRPNIEKSSLSCSDICWPYPQRHTCLSRQMLNKQCSALAPHTPNTHACIPPRAMTPRGWHKALSLVSSTSISSSWTFQTLKTLLLKGQFGQYLSFQRSGTSPLHLERACDVRREPVST